MWGKKSEFVFKKFGICRISIEICPSVRYRLIIGKEARTEDVNFRII